MPTGYDENLLASAPAASKAARQAGYNLDLLEEPETTPTPTQAAPFASPDPVIPGHAFESDVENGVNGSGAKEYTGLGDDSAGRKPPSFWASTRGKILLAVIALVIIGAVVGGAVGGTVGKKSNNNRSGSSSLPSSPLGSYSFTASPTSSTSGQFSGPLPFPSQSSTRDTSRSSSSAGGSFSITEISASPSAAPVSTTNNGGNSFSPIQSP